MADKQTHLQPHFSANVNYDDGSTRHVPAGGELPSDMKEGEYERLEKLGAFEPQHVTGLVYANPSDDPANSFVASIVSDPGSPDEKFREGVLAADQDGDYKAEENEWAALVDKAARRSPDTRLL